MILASGLIIPHLPGLFQVASGREWFEGLGEKWERDHPKRILTKDIKGIL